MNRISEITVFEQLEGHIPQIVIKDGRDTFEILEIPDRRLAKLIYLKIQGVQNEYQKELVQSALLQQIDSSKSEVGLFSPKLKQKSYFAYN